jgi:hypothetical protein
MDEDEEEDEEEEEVGPGESKLRKDEVGLN